jgi:hypothetical protein
MSTRPRRTGQALLSRPENAKRDGDAVTEAREINRNAREIRRMPLCSGPTETLGTRAQVGTVGGRDLDGDPFAHPTDLAPSRRMGTVCLGQSTSYAFHRLPFARSLWLHQL